MRRFAAIILLLLSAVVAEAQLRTVQHRCWDIVTEKDDDTPHVLVPMMTTAVDSGSMLVAMAMKYIGTPYRYAGRSPKAFDCAGFALYLYKHFGHRLPGWSAAQARLGIEVSDTRNLRPGDLVFFGGRGAKKVVGHTGIVVETDVQTGVFRFIHATTGAGVIISKSTEDYYKSRYITARRIFR